MNSKKVLVAALTAAVAVSSAVSVSAIAPGVTTAATKQTAVVEPGKVTHFSITINDVTIDADVPADAVNAGEELTFGASTVTNVDIEAAIAAERTDVATSEILDVYFLDADGNNKSFENVGVDVTVTTTTTAYETIYIFEENTGLNELAKADGNKLSFKAPHFSYYVLVKDGKVEPSQPSQQSNNGGTDVSNGGSNNGNNGNNGSNNGSTNNGGVNTGDSSATVAVFGVIGAAALGTALVASKSKKSAK